MSMESVVIVGAARTPMGGLLGDLSFVQSPALGAVAIAGALSKAGVQADQVEQLLMGCVLPAGVGQAPARQAALSAGLSVGAGCTTINKVCGSGMQAIMLAHDLIRVGSYGVVVAGGMESMSNAPYLLPKVRAGLRLGHGQVLDHMFLDGLQDAETGRLMGMFAQDMADARGLSREAMDDFARLSLDRARAAMASGVLEHEIVEVRVQSKRGDKVVSEDEQPRSADASRIATLKPAFRADGTVTAANSSSISDGASALVLMSEAQAQGRGLTPLARIVAHANHARHPSEFTIAPEGAVRRVLHKAGWTVSDVDLFEINEAFAMVAMLAIDDLGLDIDKVNVFGGACAQGHPIGSTGSRVIVTLLNALRHRGSKRGVAALCIGGGEATAVAIEAMT